MISLVIGSFFIEIARAETQPTRPKIGIAFSGGGARGFAHIGVLKKLEELKVPIDYIAGASMGSIVGGLYAAGLSTEELRYRVETIDWARTLNYTVDREQLSYREKQNQRRFFLGLEMGLDKGHLTIPSGFVSGQNLSKELNNLTRNIRIQDFSKFPIPFKAVATDLNTAEPYVLDHGDLAIALRASMAVPFAFSPVEIDGHLLVDGGLLNNLPVDVVRQMGADIVIAVNIAAPVTMIEASTSFLGVTRQAIDIALAQNTQRSLKDADIVITPSLDGYNFTDFDKGMEIITKGYEAIDKKSVIFQSLALNTENYRVYQDSLKSHIPPVHEVITPQFIEFTGYQRTNRDILYNQVRHLVGRSLQAIDIERAVKRLMSLKDFERVHYTTTENERGEEGLIFGLQEKSWGPDYFRFGINASTRIDGKADFNALLHHEKLNINRLGAEWANEFGIGTGISLFTEFYQPLDYPHTFFTAPYLQWERHFVEAFQDQMAIAEYEIESTQLGVDVGMNFSNLAELRGGIRYSSEEAVVHVGNPDLPTTQIRETALVFKLGYDSLDDRVFATHGLRIKADGEIHDKAIGSETHYQKLLFQIRHHAKIHSRFTVVAETDFGTFFQSVPPRYENFVIGKVGGLADFQRADRGGRHMLVLSLGGLFTPRTLARFGTNDVRILGLFHASNAWDNYEDIDLRDLHYGGSGAVIWDTQFGTFLIGAGYTNDNNVNFSISLGNFF